MFQNINTNRKNISSFLKIALLSLLVAGCTKKRIEEVITVEEVEVDSKLLITKEKKDALIKLISQVEAIRAIKDKNQNNVWIVVHVKTSKDGTKAANARCAKFRADKASSILRAHGYKGPIAFVFHSDSGSKGVTFSVPEPCGDTDIVAGLKSAYGEAAYHAIHEKKSPQASKPAPAKAPAQPKVPKHDEEDDEDEEVQPTQSATAQKGVTAQAVPASTLAQNKRDT